MLTEEKDEATIATRMSRIVHNGTQFTSTEHARVGRCLLTHTHACTQRKLTHPPRGGGCIQANKQFSYCHAHISHTHTHTHSHNTHAHCTVVQLRKTDSLTKCTHAHRQMRTHTHARTHAWAYNCENLKTHTNKHNHSTLTHQVCLRWFRFRGCTTNKTEHKNAYRIKTPM
eukprot:GDKI01035776.1.p1 GENE.GDKI01035776.1~~GDKI01035776.1.p1  ORF type:complete len:171 (-),score=41.08 GDKI01035776.1:40-552(-)